MILIIFPLLMSESVFIPAELYPDCEVQRCIGKLQMLAWADIYEAEFDRFVMSHSILS